MIYLHSVNADLNFNEKKYLVDRDTKNKCLFRTYLFGYIVSLVLYGTLNCLGVDCGIASHCQKQLDSLPI